MRRNTTESELVMIERGDAEPSPALRAKIQAWIRSGHRPGPAPKRGPYQK
jgi:hypothetical protein